MVLRFDARLPVVAMLAFVGDGCATRHEPPATSPGATQAPLEVEAECSNVTARASLIRVRWPSPANSREVRLEVSPYKDGFKTGRFVAAPVSTPRAMAPPGEPLRASQDWGAAAGMLGDVNLRLETLRVVDSAKKNEAVVGGLIPGINYYVRVSGVSTPPVRVQAPICPADDLEE